MIRFLFIILAVVAAVLAFLFEDMGWLYLVAGVLLLIAAVLVALHLREQFRTGGRERRRKTPREPLSEPPAGASTEELSRAGILDVRPKPRPPGSGSQPGSASSPGTSTGRAETTADRAPSSRSDGSGSPEPRRIPVPSSTDPASRLPESPHVTPTYRQPARSTPAPNVEAALKPFLSALQAALGVHTVGLFRIDEASSRYRLESVVSRTPHVISSRTFSFRTHFLSQMAAEPTVLEIGEDDLTVENLGYYKNPPSVSQVVVTPVQHEDRLQAFLVVDLLEGDPPFSELQLATFADAARLLAGMMNLEPAPAVVARPLPAPLRGPRLRLVEVGKYTPHRDIISEEMQKARRSGHPLALALVYLYDDVNEYAEEHNLTVAESERIILDKLRSLTSEGRVERFGEMGFGVFQYGDLESVTSWVERAQDMLNASDPIQTSRLSIGAALLSDRHQNPDDFQVDAARALREAYETGHSTILVEPEVHN